MATSVARHILFVTIPGWGHLRPAIAIAAKLLKESPDLVITFPVAPIMHRRILDHVEQYITDGIDDVLRSNLRIIPLGPLVHGVHDEEFYSLAQEFESFYSTLILSKPYIAFNGQVLMPIYPPDVCLMDSINSEALKTVKRITKNVLVFAVSFGSTALTLRMILRGDVPAQAERLSKETGRPFKEVLSEFYEPNKGEVVHIPGLIPMYDYEIVPHLTPIMLQFYLTMGPRSYEFFRGCDGIITTSNRIYESEGIAALAEHLAETNRPLYAIGPLGLTTSEQISKEPSPDRTASIAFLDKILTTHGERSLIYGLISAQIAFGSVFWPANVDAVWKILEVLMENDVPLLFSHRDERATMPRSLRSALELSDNTFVTSWAPQNAVLKHAATGWFLTHGGQNSVMEALSNGVPMIAWPIDTDQPLNAAYISKNLNVAYELMEVRTKNGLKPLYRGVTPRGTMEAVVEEFRITLENIRGSDGEEKRRKAQEFQRKFQTLWDEEGQSRKELRRFVADYLS